MDNFKKLVKDYFEINVCTGVKISEEEMDNLKYDSVQTTLGDFQSGLVPISTSLYDRLQVQYSEQGHTKQQFYIDVHSHILKGVIKKIRQKFQCDGKEVVLYGGFLVFDDVDKQKFAFLKYNVMESEPAILFVIK